jgi:hypothetical protein
MSNRMPVVQSQNELWVDPEDQQLKHRRDVTEGGFVDEDDGVSISSWSYLQHMWPGPSYNLEFDLVTVVCPAPL